MLLFCGEDIAFLGHTKLSTKHSGSDQIGTAKDYGSYISLCTHRPDTLAVLAQSHRFTSMVYISFFIQILIDLYPFSREELNKNSRSSNPKYSLVECTHVLSLMMPDKGGIDDDLYKQPFVFQ